MIMVGAPVLLIIAGVTWNNSSSDQTLVPERFGNAQAVIQADKDGAGWTAGQVGSLINGQVVRVAGGEIGLEIGDQLRITAVGLPVGEMSGSGLFRLRSGHWPTADDQIMITKDLARRHNLRLGATVPGFSWHQASRTVDLHVVGIVALPEDDGSGPGGGADVVTGRSQLITTDDPSQVSFLVYRAAPVSYDEVRRLDLHGLDATSRYLVDHPELVPGQDKGDDQQDSSWIAFYVLVGGGLLFEAMLLAGPAFAISAARQRHTMGLIASNGALREQLRRQLLGQALLLGVLAGAIGAALGLVTGRYISVVYAWLTGSWAAPNALSWSPALVAFLGAAVAAVVAALLPARGVGKLDLVAVLRRRTTATRTRTFGPVVGSIVTAAGLAVALVLGFAGAPAMPPRYIMGACTAAAFIGAMLILPWLVTALGRGGRLPLSIRLAGRDIARQVGRSVPAMSAVLVASGMFAVMGIAIASDDHAQAEAYTPFTTMGQGTIQGPVEDMQTAANIIRGRHPDWRLTPHSSLGDPNYSGAEPTSTVALVPKGCTAQKAVIAETQADTDPDADSRCASGRSDYGEAVTVVPDAQIASLGLPDAAAHVLAGGGVVLVDPPLGLECGPQPCALSARRDYLTGNKVTLVGGLPKGDAYVPGKPVTLTAAVIGRADLSGPQLGWADSTIGWISADAATKADLPNSVVLWTVDAPHPITTAQEQAINEVVPSHAQLLVERGFQGQLASAGRVLLGIAGALVIVAALISTALSQVEARPDLATLTAVGAPPGLRRRFAAAQAAILVLVGIVAGQVVGITAGIAFAASNSRGDFGGGSGQLTIAVPWQLSVLLLVGAVLIAALLAVLGAWRSPSMTRRLG
ncbi:FtsX-like permease family protein [Microlunatus endophyticus]